MVNTVTKRIVHHTNATFHLVGVPPVSSNAEWVPNTDIYENDASFIVRMEIAGVNRENIQVNICDRTLIIKGRRPDLCRTGRYYFRQMEIHYGVFERKLVVPRNVDGKRVKANYQNGFLIIELPKVEKSDPTPLKVTIEED